MERLKVRFVEVVGRRASKHSIPEGQCSHISDIGVSTPDEEIWGYYFVCSKCGFSFVPTCIGMRYNTPSGEREPGDMYWNTWYPNHVFWDNQKGPHLEVVLPNGCHWNIDSRASNCGSPEDKQHRCWVRHGVPPEITVDKAGHTCTAGAGSIDMGGWHGFLRNGYLER